MNTIFEINPNIKSMELAKLLDLSKMAISKQIKKVYNL
jgi:transcriptional antiterminator